MPLLAQPNNARAPRLPLETLALVRTPDGHKRGEAKQSFMSRFAEVASTTFLPTPAPPKGTNAGSLHAFRRLVTDPLESLFAVLLEYYLDELWPASQVNC
jgi:hypothetical protein